MTTSPSVKSSASFELSVLSYLQPRMNLSSIERNKHQTLCKGYEGEQKLHEILDRHLSPSYLLLTDLLLRQNQTEFQIDILLIGQDKIYPLEVKNYEGDYVMQNENWYVASSRREIRNPLHQLKRSELLLRNLLQQTHSRFSIEPYIMFVHPHFYLYQSPMNLPIIFPTQINRFIKKLNSTSRRQTVDQQKLASFLVEQQLLHSSHARMPDYKYEELRKGIICEACSMFVELFNRKYVICKSCEQKELVESAMKRSITQFMTLFPNARITTPIIHEWCRVIESRKTIRRILKKYYHQIGNGKHTYYTVRK